MLAIFLLFSTFSRAQSIQDQNVFNNEVWKVVAITNDSKSFFDSGGNYLGSRIDKAEHIIYKDKWKRVINVFPVNEFQLNRDLKVQKKNQNKKVLIANANRISIKRNKAVYYDSNGMVEKTAKRRGKRKVYFHNSTGKLIGYKIYQSNGITKYKDSRGRITGTSYIDRTGRMIYRPKNRKRRTPGVLFEDPFLFN